MTSLTPGCQSFSLKKHRLHMTTNESRAEYHSTDAWNSSIKLASYLVLVICLSGVWDSTSEPINNMFFCLALWWQIWNSKASLYQLGHLFYSHCFSVHPDASYLTLAMTAHVTLCEDRMRKKVPSLARGVRAMNSVKPSDAKFDSSVLIQYPWHIVIK